MRFLKQLIILLFLIITLSNQEVDVIQSDDDIAKHATAKFEKIKNGETQHNSYSDNTRESVPLYNKVDKSIISDDQNPDLNAKEEHKDNKAKIAKPKKDNQSTSKESNKPKAKPTDKITYADIEYVDDIIPYKKLEDKQEPNKNKGSSGVLTQGQDGLQRKEVRKVYVNGKYSHTETVKETYTVKETVHAQNWVGTKEETQKPKDTMIIDNESWYLHKSFSTDTLCIQNINALQEENFREWDGGSMCWGEHLYYSTGN